MSDGETTPQEQESQKEKSSGGSSGGSSVVSTFLTIIGAVVAAVGFIISSGAFEAYKPYPSSPSIEWALFVFMAPILLLFTRKFNDVADIARPFCTVFAASMTLYSFFGGVVSARNAAIQAEASESRAATTSAEASGYFILCVGEALCAVCSFFF